MSDRFTPTAALHLGVYEAPGGLWRRVDVAKVRISDRVSLRAEVGGDDIGMITWTVWRQADDHCVIIGGGMAETTDAAKMAAWDGIDAWKRVVDTEAPDASDPAPAAI